MTLGALVLVLSLASAGLAAAQTFRALPAPPYPLIDINATLLQDGRVLIVGSGGLPLIFDPAANAWTGTTAPPPSLDRPHPVCVMLRDGRVLVSHGEVGTTLNPAFFYDPRTDAWQPAILPLRPRAKAAGVLLADGRVLVAGPINGASLDYSIEIYDPPSQTWVAGGALNTSRRGGQLVTLPDGRVLSVGTNNQPILYDPATQLWSPTSTSAWSNQAPAAILQSDGTPLVYGDAAESMAIQYTSTYDTALDTWTSSFDSLSLASPGLVLLPNGRVLTVGGSSMARNSYRWDAQLRDWSTFGGMTLAPRLAPRAVIVPDGRVLVFGGVDAATTPFAEAFIPPRTVSSVAASDANAGRWSHGSVVLPDGRVFVAGGIAVEPLASVAAYDPGAGTWQSGDPMATVRLNFPEPILLRDGRVMVIGGSNNVNQGVATTEIYNTTTLGRGDGPNLLQPRALQKSVTLKNGWVIVTGGAAGLGFDALSATELYMPELNRFLPAAPMPEGRTRHAATRLLDDRVLVVGGMDGAHAQRAEAWIYDYRTNSWTVTGSMLTPRQDAQAFTLPDGRVLAFGNDTDSELWDPATGTWSAVGSPIPERFGRSVTQLSDGSVVAIGGKIGAPTPTSDVTVFDPISSTWYAAGTLLSARVEATAVRLPDGRVLVAGGADASNDPVASVEVLDMGDLPDLARQPVVTAVSNLSNGSQPVVSGTKFAGAHAGTANSDGATSAQNYPTLALTSLLTGARRYLPIDTWSDTSATGVPLTGLADGPHMVQVITNGIASAPQSLSISGVTPTLDNDPAEAPYSPAAQSVTLTTTLRGGPIAGGNVAWFIVFDRNFQVVGQPAVSTAAATNGDMEATWTAPAGLPTGPYTVFAVYAGDARRATAYDTSTLVVAGEFTVLTVTPPVPNVPRRSTAAVSASVMPSGGTPIAGGTIALSAGASACSFAAPSGSCDLSFGAPGTVTIAGEFTPSSPLHQESTRSVSVDVVCTPMTFAPTVFPTAIAGEPYSQAITASGAFGAYQITLASGTLPDGLALVANVLSGTPTASGTSSFTLQVSDADNCTSTQSYAIVTDPTPITERVYTLAEGVSNAFFNSFVLLANPHAVDVPVTVTFMGEGGQQGSEARTLAPFSRVTLPTGPGTAAASAGTTFATRVTVPSGDPLLVERATYFDAAMHAGDLSTATEGLGSTSWFFAEGANGFFHTYLTLGNLQFDQAAEVTVRYLPEGGAPFDRAYTVQPHSRLTIDTRGEPALAAAAFALSVQSTMPIAADRVQYFGDPFIGGHADSGARALSQHWYFAEGASGPVFDTYLLLANPTGEAATATVTYHTDGGETVTRTHPIAPGARASIGVESEDARLSVGAYWIEVHADRAIMAERAMYLAGASGWFEATATSGATAPAERWGFAEGANGLTLGHATYVLLANPSTQEAEVEVQYLRATGAPVTHKYRVAPGARLTLDVRAEEPSLADAEFGIVVRSTNSQPILAERSLYWTLGGSSFVGAMSSMGIPLSVPQ